MQNEYKQNIKNHSTES